MTAASNHAVNLTLIRYCLGRLGRQELEPELVEAYLVVGGHNLVTVANSAVIRLVTVAVDSIDHDGPAARRQVSELAAEPSSPTRRR